MILVLAEKPSVARDLAAVLGARTQGQGYLEGNGYRVTWAIGHLVGLAQPHEIDPAWKVCPFCEAEMQVEPPPQATRRRRGRSSTTDQPTVSAEITHDEPEPQRERR